VLGRGDFVDEQSTLKMPGPSRAFASQMDWKMADWESENYWSYNDPNRNFNDDVGWVGVDRRQEDGPWGRKHVVLITPEHDIFALADDRVCVHMDEPLPSGARVCFAPVRTWPTWPCCTCSNALLRNMLRTTLIATTIGASIAAAKIAKISAPAGIGAAGTARPPATTPWWTCSAGKI